jgi:putative sterol carrier protein
MSKSSTDSSELPEIFDHIVAAGPVSSLRTVSGVYEFDLDDGGQWFLRLDHGAPTLQEATDRPDCEIHCSATDFVEMAHGKRNMFTTLLQGRMTLVGDVDRAMDMRRLLAVAA